MLEFVLTALADPSTTEAEDISFTVLITPYLPVITTLVGGAVVGGFAIWNRKRGALETRAPDVNAIWIQQEAQSRLLDAERRTRRKLEALLGQLWDSFRSYATRVQAGGSVELTQGEAQALIAADEFESTAPSTPE